MAKNAEDAYTVITFFIKVLPVIKMYLTEYDEIILSPFHISIVFKIYADRCGYILKRCIISKQVEVLLQSFLNVVTLHRHLMSMLYLKKIPITCDQVKKHPVYRVLHFYLMTNISTWV